MPCSSSYRIGRRRTSSATTCSLESVILRSLFDLRRRCNDDSCTTLLPEVTELIFFNCEWTQRIVNSLSKLIVRDGNRFSSIKFFDCDVSSPKFAEILSIILNQNTTTTLVVKGRKTVGNRNESHEQFSPRCESSRATSSLDESVLEAIRNGISAKRSLKFLKLSGLRITHDSPECEDHFWCHSLINNNHLLHLDLSGSYFSASTINSLSRALSLNTTLQSLNLEGCFLDDQSLSRVIKSVKDHPSLSELDLSRNFLAKSQSTKALEAVAELLKSEDSKLECFDLSNQRHPVTKTVIKSMEINSGVGEREERLNTAFMNALDALSSNSTLRSIDLSGNSNCFSDLISVKALSSCLTRNNTLRHVDISLCHLNPPGLSYLSQNCIPRCSGNLKSLVLFGEEIISDEDWTSSCLFLESGLQSNLTLESLGELDKCKMDSKTRSSLQFLLNANRAGRQALRADDLPLAAWPEVFARANRTEYDLCHDDNKDDQNKDEVEASLKIVTSASVLFKLLRGPSMLEQRR